MGNRGERKSGRSERYERDEEDFFCSQLINESDDRGVINSVLREKKIHEERERENVGRKSCTGVVA